jgi:FkbM family methyltransferase
MKTAEVRNVTWNMNDDVYDWHRRLNSYEVGDNSIWNWHPVIGSEMASFIYLCMEREPKCFIDIGAHCGIFSSVYCSLVDNHECYSIEPVKEHMDRLKDTAELNKWNLSTHKIALNNYTGKTYYHNTHMAMFVDDADYVVPDDIVSGVKENTVINEVVVDTLDNFVKTNNIIPTLIKIDVEGYEIPLLQKAKETLSKYPIDLLIETHRDECKTLGWSIEEICNYINTEQYVLYTHDFKEEIFDLKSFVLNNESNMRFIAINRKNVI